jgi:competence protein ComEC
VVLSELQAVALAAVTWLGATIAWPVPLIPAGAATTVILLARRPRLLLVAVAALASALGHRADDGYRPVATGPFHGPVTLLTDPEPVGPVGNRAVVRLPDGQRVEATAYGQPGFDLADATVGQIVEASGRLRPADDQPWTRSRHLVGRLSVDDAALIGSPAWHWRLVAIVRDRIGAGAERLPRGDRPLYRGLVIGDDRFQGPARQARFRAAGLTHLLAVSGQNIALVLAVAHPVVGRLGRSWRLPATLLVLVVFALATRLEPSVLRATATAGLAAVAAVGGHRQSGVRLLALAVTGLVLVDPFLVGSVGFQLSVAASAGILVLTPPVLGWLRSGVRLPVVVAEPLAVTLGAQVAVLPLLLGYFGPVSVVSIPANLLAGWAAGAVMTWGLTVGVMAGWSPDPVAGVLQLPAHWMVVWLDGVAGWAARVPAPVVGWSGLVMLAGAVVVWVTVGSGSRWRLVVRVVVVVVVVVGLGAAVPRPPVVPVDLDGGGRWIPAGADRPSVLVIDAGADDDLLAALLTHRILSIDVVITESGQGRAGDVAGGVRSLVPVGVFLAPSHHRIVGATRVTTDLELATAHGVVVVAPDGDRLQVSSPGDP